METPGTVLWTNRDKDERSRLRLGDAIDSVRKTTEKGISVWKSDLPLRRCVRSARSSAVMAGCSWSARTRVTSSGRA